MSFPPLTAHRFARLLAWAKLWLCWLAPILLTLAPKTADRLTRAAVRGAMDLVVLRATLDLPPPKLDRAYGPLRARTPAFRAFKGGALRRRLRARTPVDRFTALLAFFRDFDAIAAGFNRRTARGFTRCAASRAAAPPAPLARSRSTPWAAAVFAPADTS